MTAKKIHLSSLLLSAAFIAPVSAVTIANTNFDSNLSGLTFDATVSGNTAGYGTTGPNGTRAIDLIDTLPTTNAAIARYAPSTVFSTASAGQSQFQLSFDVAVSNLTVTTDNSVSVPRVILRNTSNTAQSLTMAFTRNAEGNLIFYAARGDTASAATAGALIYSLGTYDATTSANNTSNGYITLSISFIHGGTSMNVSAIQGANTLFNGTISGYSALGMSNTSTNLIMSTGATGIGNMYIDNLLMQTIPEPTSAILSASAIGLLAFRRTRRG